MRAQELGALSAAALIALTGCSGSEAPTSTTSTPTPTGPSPSNSPATNKPTGSDTPTTTTEPPTEAKKNTKQGAEAFAKWYYEQIGEAWVSADSSVVSKYSKSTCRACTALRDKIDQNSMASKHASRNPYDVATKRVQQDQSVHNVRMDVTEYQYTYDGPGGTKTTVGKSSSINYEIITTVSRRNSTWIVEQMVMMQ